jgi:enoyl-CoA hydratase/carnithine racemase
LIRELATAFEALDADPGCRALVLAAQGKAFCAGANFGDDDRDGSALLGGPTPGAAHLYIEGNRLFRTKKPIVAAVHGAAVGGGLGLAMVADFRVTCAEARFSANFTRLGFHPGFGLTVTLSAVIGQTKAALMFYTSRRIAGDEAFAMGLADLLVPQEQVRSAALSLATEIAENSRLASSRRAPRCAAILPIAYAQRPSMNLPSKRGYARPTISRKASRRWRNGAFRISPTARRETAIAPSPSQRRSVHEQPRGKPHPAPRWSRSNPRCPGSLPDEPRRRRSTLRQHRTAGRIESGGRS